MLNELVNQQLVAIVHCQRIARGRIARKRVQWLRKRSQQQAEDIRVLSTQASNHADRMFYAQTKQQEHDQERFLEQVHIMSWRNLTFLWFHFTFALHPSLHSMRGSSLTFWGFYEPHCIDASSQNHTLHFSAKNSRAEEKGRSRKNAEGNWGSEKENGRGGSGETRTGKQNWSVFYPEKVSALASGKNSENCVLTLNLTSL